MSAIVVRPATTADAATAARLHAQRITEGFLPKLGVGFLTRLYRRIVKSDDAVLYVATDSDGTVIGFASLAADVGALYKRFILRDGVLAGIGSAVPILRNVRHVLETLRYPSHVDDLPDAEILAVAVDARVGGRGVGRALVDALVRDAHRIDADGIKVVAGSDNEAALALYRACGFEEVQRIEVHAGITSSVLVRSTPPLRAVDGSGRA